MLFSDLNKLPQPGMNLGSLNSHKRTRITNIIATRTSAYLTHTHTRCIVKNREYLTTIFKL